MINNYYYNKQIRNFIVQFSAIFAGLQVSTGKDETGSSEMLNVPVRYGSIDRVVAAIGNNNTQNSIMSLPTMSTYLLGIELAPNRRKAIGQVSRKTYLPTGGIHPQDLKVVERYMPIPYDLNLELAIYASNTDQAFQIIEQILMIFDPILQIQMSDAPFDWAKLTTVELMSLQSEENYPQGVDKRVIIWTFNFSMPIWITPPMDIKDEVVHNIIVRIGDLEGFTLDEYDATGELHPFSTPEWTTINITK